MDEIRKTKRAIDDVMLGMEAGGWTFMRDRLPSATRHPQT